MHIVIVGGGEVGKDLALNLSAKHQSVVVVEKDPERAAELEEKLDALVINGNGANHDILEKAKLRSAKMLIAVTEIDEVNIIACMVAKNKGVPITVARVRDSESAGNGSSGGLTQEQVGIDFIISPEKAVALEISKMVHYPDAEEIEYFAKGKVMMVSITVTEKAEITNQTLKELPLPSGCIIVGIKRHNGDFIVPGGKDKVKPGDKVYLIGSVKVMREASWFLHHEELRVKRVVILGGGMIGYYLSALLESNRERSFLTKVIEKDAQRCEELNRLLSKTTVLQGDTSELSFFNKEELAEADLLVAVTGDDRTNIVASIMGQKAGSKKVVSEINKLEYADVYDAVGIENTVNPHLIAAAQILRFTRKEDVVSLSILKNEEAEAMELVLPESAKVVGKKVAEANFPKGMLIGTIVRDGQVIIPHGQTVLEGGDHLIIFVLPQVSSRLDRFFASDI